MSQIGSGAHFSICGRLGADPSPNRDNRGVRISVAVTDALPNQQDSAKTDYITQWMPVVIWGEERVRIICERWAKGDTVMVTGDLKMGDYRPDGANKSHKQLGLHVGPNGSWQLLDSRHRADKLPERTGDRAYDRRDDRGSSRNDAPDCSNDPQDYGNREQYVDRRDSQDYGNREQYVDRRDSQEPPLPRERTTRDTRRLPPPPNRAGNRGSAPPPRSNNRR